MQGLVLLPYPAMVHLNPWMATTTVAKPTPTSPHQPTQLYNTGIPVLGFCVPDS
jgi:hypothetical protein